MPPSRQQQLTKAVKQLRDGLSLARTRPTIHNYGPHEKQVLFHQSKANGRLFIGGNRSGKTVGGVVEDVWFSQGQHPYRELPPPPLHGRIVTVSRSEGINQLIIPELQKWLSPSMLVNGAWEDSYNKTDKVLVLSNGSKIDLMTFEQEQEKFAGTSRNWCHFDEEPPKNIWEECKMRLLDVDGSWFITMTPVLGMTWVYYEIYEKVQAGEEKEVFIIEVDTDENPHLSEAGKQRVFGGLSEKDLEYRKKGKFVQLSGLAFPQFKLDVHVMPPWEDERDRLKFLYRTRDWSQYASMDHGLKNPTAWNWHVVSPSGIVITYDELYESEWLVNDFARAIKERESEDGRRVPDIRIGDPAIKQRAAQTGDSIQTAYAMEGIFIALGNNEQRIGVNKMNSYLKARKWFITPNNVNLIRQLQRARWVEYESAKKRYENNPREKLHEYDNHASDGVRYFFSFMPDLNLPKTPQVAVDQFSVHQAVKEILHSSTTFVGGFRVDRNLMRSKPQRNPEYTQWDPELGSEW